MDTLAKVPTRRVPRVKPWRWAACSSNSFWALHTARRYGSSDSPAALRCTPPRPRTSSSMSHSFSSAAIIRLAADWV